MGLGGLPQYKKAAENQNCSLSAKVITIYADLLGNAVGGKFKK